MSEAYTPIERLPFIAPRKRCRKDQIPMNYWSVTPSGDWAQDNQLGAHYARLTADAMRKSGDFDRSHLLGAILAAMVDAGPDHHGVVVGFGTALAEFMS